MDESFGAWAKRKRPDIFGENTEDEINNTVNDRLSTPDGQEKLAKWFRTRFGANDATTDDDIVSTVAEFSTAKLPEEHRAQTIRNAMMVRQQLKDYRTTRRGAAKLENDQAQGFPARESLIAETKNVVPPGSPMELPEIDDWEREGKQLQQANPGSRLVSNGIQYVLVDQNNNGIATLRQGSGIPEQKDVALIPRLTGGISYAQTIPAQAMRQGIKAVTGKDVSEGRDPSLGNTAFGLRELGGDIGAAIGEQAPSAGTKLAQANAGTMQGISSAMKGVDEAEAGVFDWLAKKFGPGSTTGDWSAGMAADARAPSRQIAPSPGPGASIPISDVMTQLAKDNRAEAADWEARRKESEDLRTWDVPAYAEQELAREFGRQAGQTTGEVASMVAPTDVPLGAAIAKLGAKAGVKALPAGAKLAIQKGKENLVATTEPVTKFFLNRPFATAFGGTERDVLDRGANTARNAAVMAGESLNRDVREAEAELIAKHGWTPEQWEKFSRGARDRWTDLDMRRKASPEEAEIIRTWQPFHRRVYEASGFDPKTVPYNPLHDYYGQDPSRAATLLESYDARDVTQNLGGVPWRGKSWEADEAARSAPGLDVLDPATYQSTKLREARPRAEKASLVERAVTEQESGKNAFTRPLLSRQAERLGKEAAESVRAAMPSEAFGQSLTRQMQHTTKVQRAASDEMLAGIGALRQADKRFTDLGDFLENNPIYKKMAEVAHPGAAYERGVYGDARVTGGGLSKIQDDALEKALKDEGLVLIQVKGQKPLKQHYLAAGKDLGDTHLNLPQEFNEGWHGQVVPRSWANAMLESAKLSSLPNSKGAREFARNIDRMLGLTQLKRTLTVGNMGFDMRNRINEVLRVLAEERGNAVDKELLRAVQEVSHAPLGRASGKYVTIGGKRWDTGILHGELRRAGVMRPKQTEAAARAIYERNGAGISGAIPVVGDAMNAAHKASLVPGEASQAAADKLFRSALFDEKMLGARGLHDDYEAGEGIRMWATLAKMKRGQSIESAARDAKTLLIDYTDKSAAQELLAPAIPFIKYYTGAARGAFRTALANPRAYSRAADLARVIENYDKQVSGRGAYDPRDKNMAEILGMFPTVKMGQGRASLRHEAPSSEVANFVDAVMGTVEPDRQDMSIGRYLSPIAGQLYGAVTGKEIATGRSIYGLTPEEQKSADPGLYDQWKHYADTDKKLGRGVFLGSNPEAHLMWAMLKYAPIVGGRFMSPQAEAIMRAGAGIGSGPASRTIQGSSDAGRRAAISAITGVRMPAADPLRERSQTLRSLARRMPNTVHENIAKRTRSGAPTTEERQ